MYNGYEMHIFIFIFIYYIIYLNTYNVEPKHKQKLLYYKGGYDVLPIYI